MSETLPPASLPVPPATPPATGPNDPLPRPLFLLPRNLRRLYRACQGDGSARYALDAVRLVSTVRGYRAEACDGRIAVRVDGDDRAEDLGPFPNVGHVGVLSPRTSALVRAAHWRRALGLAPRRHPRPIYEQAAVHFSTAGEGPGRATFVATDGDRVDEIAATEAEGKWPALDQVIPRGEPTAVAVVRADDLIRLLKILTPLADPDSQAVTIEIRKAAPTASGLVLSDPPLVFRCRNTRHGRQDTLALLMPLSVPAESPRKE